MRTPALRNGTPCCLTMTLSAGHQTTLRAETAAVPIQEPRENAGAMPKTRNQPLVEGRINAVTTAPSERNVSPFRIDTGANGESAPAVPKANPQHMYLNRRGELSRIEWRDCFRI